MTAGDVTIEFQEFADGAAVMGATQANFLVHREGHHAKEASILLNTPAASWLAAALGEPDTVETRESLAQRVGAWWLRRAASGGGHIESIAFLSKSRLESIPGLIDALRGIPARMAPQKD
jgi:hypothetical protein